MAILFVVMPLGFLATVKITGQPDSTFTFVGTWILALGAVLLLEAAAKTKPRFNAFHLSAFAITIIGIPGIFFLQPRTLELTLAIGFWLILIVRNATVFIIVPQVINRLKVPPTQQIQTWLFVGGMIISVLTALLYASRGFTILNAQRGAFPDWLHPNNSAIYGGLVALVALLSPHIKTWLRLMGGVTGIYCILLVQSRGALVALVLAAAVYFFLHFLKQPGKYSLWFIVALVFGTLVIVGFGPQLAEVGAIKNIIERSTNTDPTAGRTEFISQALEAAQNSPLFGFGFRAPRVDNIFATFALSFGMVGSLFYAIFVASIFIRAVVVYRRGATFVGREAAMLVIVYGAFIFTRSFVEAAHIMQLTDVFANAFCMLAGITFVAPLRRTVSERNLATFAPTPSSAP